MGIIQMLKAIINSNESETKKDSSPFSSSLLHPHFYLPLSLPIFSFQTFFPECFFPSYFRWNSTMYICTSDWPGEYFSSNIFLFWFRFVMEKLITLPFLSRTFWSLISDVETEKRTECSFARPAVRSSTILPNRCCER